MNATDPTPCPTLPRRQGETRQLCGEKKCKRSLKPTNQDQQYFSTTFFKTRTKTQFVMSKPRTFQQVGMPCPQPSPQTGSRAQGSQEEPTPPLQNSLHSDWSVEVVDEVSPGRGIPLGRDYGLPPPGNTCQDVTGKSPRGFPRSDLG